MNEVFSASTRAVVSIVSVRGVAPLGGATDTAEGDPLLTGWPTILGCCRAWDGKFWGRMDVTYEGSQHAGIAGAETEPRAVLRKRFD